jgi:hypothetical protein
MTNKEINLLLKIKNDYWESFSKLVAKSLKKAPKHLHQLLLMQLQESSSVYGSKYEDYMEEK